MEKTVEYKAAGKVDNVSFLVQKACTFDSTIYLEVAGEEKVKKVNAKSIMGMMALALKDGCEVTVSAEGDDAQTAIDGMVEALSHPNK